MSSRVDLASLLHTHMQNTDTFYTCRFTIPCDFIFVLYAFSRSSIYSVSLEVTGIIATNTRRPKLLDQNTDYVDEDHEVNLHETSGKHKISKVSEYC